MTIIMSIIGLCVFFISLPLSGFSESFKRMLKFAATGLCIDISLIIVALLVLIAL